MTVYLIEILGRIESNINDQVQSIDTLTKVIVDLTKKVSPSKPKYDIHNSVSRRFDHTKENKSQVPKQEISGKKKQTDNICIGCTAECDSNASKLADCRSKL